MWAQVWSLFEGILYLLLHEAGDESMFNSSQSGGLLPRIETSHCAWFILQSLPTLGRLV
jgi:hypothetical protein